VKAKVYVTLKPSILDPQGKTIAQALHTMGYDTINDVRQGKFFELDIDIDSAEAVRKTALEVAERVLANPVIENCRVEVE
jgi:phosphoribosylformylglycinamidine synthase